MEGKQVNVSGGIGFCGALTLLFAAAKIFGYLSWSWWWVFAPILIPLLVVAALFLVIVLVLMAIEATK